MKTLEDPIRVALQGYQEVSDNKLEFDIDEAAILGLTPTESNSARSRTATKFLGKPIGDLFVIAFKPGDGSGKETNFKLEDLVVNGDYPNVVAVTPRRKTGTHSEGHLTVVSNKLDDVHADPELYDGTFDLLGLDGKTVKKIGELGQAKTVSVDELKPFTTLTVGNDGRGERFGDPHAVYNSRPELLQVCAFLAVTDEVYREYGDILTHLKPHEPRLAA